MRDNIRKLLDQLCSFAELLKRVWVKFLMKKWGGWAWIPMPLAKWDMSPVSCRAKPSEHLMYSFSHCLKCFWASFLKISAVSLPIHCWAGTRKSRFLSNHWVIKWSPIWMVSRLDGPAWRRLVLLEWQQKSLGKGGGWGLEVPNLFISASEFWAKDTESQEPILAVSHPRDTWHISLELALWK